MQAEVSPPPLAGSQPMGLPGSNMGPQLGHYGLLGQVGTAVETHCSPPCLHCICLTVLDMQHNPAAVHHEVCVVDTMQHDVSAKV